MLKKIICLATAMTIIASFIACRSIRDTIDSTTSKNDTSSLKSSLNHQLIVNQSNRAKALF